MRIDFVNKSQEEIEEILNEIVFYLKYNYNSDKITRHRLVQLLSQRLVSDDYLSKNNEILFVSKLEQKVGKDYAKTMRKILKEHEESKKVLDEYKIALNNKGNPSGIDFRVNVVKNNLFYQNLKNDYNFKNEIPKFFQFYLNDFKKYFLKKYEHKGILFWCLDLSRLNIEYLYLENKNISISTLPQLLILLCLEKHNKLSIEKIAELLKHDAKKTIDDIKGLIYNPSFNPNKEQDKGVILPNKKELDNTTEISINMNFNVSQKTFSTLNFDIFRFYDKLDKEVAKYERSKIYYDNTIDAALMRILKERIGKITVYIYLVNEVKRHVDSFKVEESFVEERIESLISRNFIKKNGEFCEYIP